MDNSISTDSASNRRTRLGLAIVALAAGLFALVAEPALASAEKRIVILDFEGRRTARYEKQITQILEKNNTVISSREYKRAAKKLRAARPTAPNVAKVAEELEADGVLIGVVKRRRGRYRLTVRLRAGTSGDFTDDTITANSAKPRLSRAQMRRFRKELGRAIDNLPEREAPPPEVEEVEGPPPSEDEDLTAGDDEEEEPVASTKKKGGEASTLTSAEQADMDVRGRALEAAGGLSFSARTLSFSVRSGLGDLAPRGYEGTLVAGAYVLGELYPLAFNRKKKSITHNIGVAFSFDRVLKIESRMLYDDGSGTPAEATLPTTQSHWGVGLVYRHNFGKKPTSPTLKLGVRYNSFSFVIDKDSFPGGADQVDIPNMEYVYWDPGLAIRFPVNPKIALLADVRYLLVTAAGSMTDADQYGSTKITGYDADVGFAYRINKTVSVRAGGRFTGINLSFDGTGDKTNNRDGDSSTQDVMSASDQYVGGYLVAGFLF